MLKVFSEVLKFLVQIFPLVVELVNGVKKDDKKKKDVEPETVE